MMKTLRSGHATAREKILPVVCAALLAFETLIMVPKTTQAYARKDMVSCVDAKNHVESKEPEKKAPDKVKKAIDCYASEKNISFLEVLACDGATQMKLRLYAGQKLIQIYEKDDNVQELEPLAKNGTLPMELRVKAGIKAANIYKKNKNFCALFLIAEDNEIPVKARQFAKQIIGDRDACPSLEQGFTN